ncbi:MAG TPA: hypothetical protein VFM70_06625 [Salinimicrobium sp.]|nr:hypothetical protein [Salinimicrobium sp.]
MKKIFVLLFFFGLNAASQNVEVEFIEKEPLAADQYFGHDIFDAAYFGVNNTFYKQQGIKINQFSDLQLGEITSADLLNPLQILLFYRNTNTVVVLDNNLVEKKRFNFNKTENFKNIGYAGSAAGNRLWIYNLDAKRIEIWNPEVSSDNSVQKMVPLKNEIKGITTNYNYCWIFTSEKLKMYNVYGVLVKEYPIQNITKAQQYNGDLIFLKERKLYFLGKKSEEAIRILTADFQFEQFHFVNEILYIYDKQYIHKYRIFQP